MLRGPHCHCWLLRGAVPSQPGQKLTSLSQTTTTTSAPVNCGLKCGPGTAPGRMSRESDMWCHLQEEQGWDRWGRPTSGPGPQIRSHSIVGSLDAQQVACPRQVSPQGPERPRSCPSQPPLGVGATPSPYAQGRRAMEERWKGPGQDMARTGRSSSPPPPLEGVKTFQRCWQVPTSNSWLFIYTLFSSKKLNP